MADHHEDPSHYPRLGQILHRLAQPDGTRRLIIALMVGCALSLLAGLAYDPHGYMAAEHYFGFYAAYGFVMFTGLILLAKALRWLVGRREDYYAPHAVDAEEYPDNGLGKAHHNG